MQNFRNAIIILVKRILLLLFLFTLLRVFFFITNYSYFNSAGFFSDLYFFVVGIRFDYTAIVYFNSAFILFSLLPFAFVNHKLSQKILKVIYIATNSLLLISDLADSSYFQFSNKRSAADVLSMSTTGNDFINLLPKYIADYWFVLLIWGLLIFVMLWLYPKSKNNKSYKNTSLSRTLFQIVAAVLIAAIIYIPARGIGYKPVRIISASSYVQPEYMAIVLNTPFCIITTLQKEELPDYNFFSKKDASLIYSCTKNYKSDKPFIKPNIIVIILESFGKEYTGAFNPYEGHTPFLDSLINTGLSCQQAYANGKRSVEGIPAVLSSIPSLMNQPFISSQFASNQINSFGSILSDEAYYTAFFHGGINGTMGFDNFCALAGIEHYYGLNEYPDKNDYDGNWGIPDHKFYKFFHNRLNEFPKPFFASIFSLSSHHPYTIPEEFKDKFKEGSLPIHKSIEYADYSLRMFFDSVKNEPWFDNTLFVITADHTSQSKVKRYQTETGSHSVPLIFYMPGNNFFTGKIDKCVSQADILPSVLDYIHYPYEFFCFGNSIFRTDEPHFATTYKNSIYQFITDDYAIYFDGHKYKSIYNINQDSLLKHDLIDSISILEKYDNLLKAYIQQYDFSLNNNQMKAVDKNTKK